MVEDVIVGVKDSVREPVLTHELPDVLDRVQFWAFCRQRHQGNIGRDFQVAGDVPTGLIEQQHRVGVGRDLGRDFKEMLVHGGGIAPGHDDTGNGALCRANGAEQIGRGRPLIFRCARPGASFGPTPCNSVLLPDACFILPPDFYGRTTFELGLDLRQLGGEVFLNVGMASVSCP